MAPTRLQIIGHSDCATWQAVLWFRFKKEDIIMHNAIKYIKIPIENPINSLIVVNILAIWILSICILSFAIIML